MPPIPVNPQAATLVRSSVPITAAAITTLRAEDALLVESCSARATRQEWRRYNKDGDLIAYVRHSPQLIYSVTATALDPLGENLANYHPGRNLSDRALAFLNGRAPFQFLTEYSGARVGRLIYGDPQQDPVPGDAMRTSFTIEHCFIDLDTGTYPAISGGGESGPYHAFSVYWEDEPIPPGQIRRGTGPLQSAGQRSPSGSRILHLGQSGIHSHRSPWWRDSCRRNHERHHDPRRLCPHIGPVAARGRRAGAIGKSLDRHPDPILVQRGLGWVRLGHCAGGILVRNHAADHPSGHKPCPRSAVVDGLRMDLGAHSGSRPGMDPTHQSARLGARSLLGLTACA
jgi:hypothetical protein